MGQHFKNWNESISFVSAIITLLSMAIPASSSANHSGTARLAAHQAILLIQPGVPQAEGTFKRGVI